MSNENINQEDIGDLPMDDWRRNLAVGDEVYWKDPDQGISSGIYRIVGINAESVTDEETVLQLVSESGSEAEVFASELLAEPEEIIEAKVEITLKIVLNGMSKTDFLDDLDNRVRTAIGNGMITGNSPSECEEFALEVGIERTKAQTLFEANTSTKCLQVFEQKNRNIFQEAIEAKFLMTSISPKEDICIRRDLVANEILIAYPRDTVITRDLYDADTLLGECLIWLNPHFEFPNWEDRTVGEYLSKHSPSANPLDVNVLQFSAERPNKDGIKAGHITLQQLFDAHPLGESGWLLNDGLEIWFSQSTGEC